MKVKTMPLLSQEDFLKLQKANLLVKDANGNTPLHILSYVALNSKEEAERAQALELIHRALSYIKDRKLNPRPLLMQNNDGDTPLHYLIQIKNSALQEEYVSMCDAFFKKRNYLYVNNKKGISPWNVQCQEASLALLKLDKPEFSYFDGVSPLHRLADQQTNLENQHLIKPFMLLRKNNLHLTPLDITAQHLDFDNLFEMFNSGYEKVIDAAKKQNTDTWLHQLIKNCENAEEVIKVLIANKIPVYKSLDSKNNKGNTPLHLAVKKDDVSLVRYLLKLGANREIVNKLNQNPQSYSAYCDNYPLFQFFYNTNPKKDNRHGAKFAWDKFAAIHKLYFVFGGEKLVNQAGTLPEFYDGGYTDNILPLLKDPLRQCALKEPQPIKNKYNRIENLMESFINIKDVNTTKQAQEIMSGKRLLTSTGYQTHIIGVTFEKANNQIILSLCNRGDLAPDADTPYNTHAVLSLRFDANEEKLKTLLKKLAEAKASDSVDAEQILYTDIPKLLGGKFKNEDSVGVDLVSQYFKVGICFWANYKTVVYDQFIKEFGFLDGHLRYKQYSLLLRQNALDDYLKLVPVAEQDPKLVEACKSIIQEKESKIVATIDAQAKQHAAANDANNAENAAVAKCGYR